MGVILFVFIVGLVLYIVSYGVLPHMGLRYLHNRAKNNLPKNDLLESILSLGTGVKIDTSELDEEEDR